MINLRKLGLTALAGSLAAVSAQAGEMAVSGSHTLLLTQLVIQQRLSSNSFR